MASTMSSTPPLAPWQHPFEVDPHARQRMRRTAWVVALTFVTMVFEIAFGYLTGSMALTADGWHMGSHVAALGVAVFAYYYAERHAANPRFTFGTGKVSALGGYTSALLLALVALALVWESVERLLSPQRIAYDEALLVAVIGLVVNLASAYILGAGHAHDHDHDHGHAHDGGRATDAAHHHDMAITAKGFGHGPSADPNYRGAFLHVLADAFTSVLAIAALAAGKWGGWAWFDPLIGLVGAAVILYWSVGLARTSMRSLLDAEDFGVLEHEIVERLQRDGLTRVTDLHVWRLGPQTYACIVTLDSPRPESAQQYKERLKDLSALSHLTIEVNHAPDRTRPSID
jgi:cation diffusion facilitator family transporter